MSLLAVLLAYLIGSVSGSLLLGRWFGQADLRDVGSGNAGATNALRAGGWAYGASVLIFDLAKGVLAAAVLPALFPGTAGLAYACGAAAVVGHVWPVYYAFRGGKGAATLIGVLAVLTPVALVPGTLLWLGVLVATGYVGLATVLGMWAVMLAVIFQQAAWTVPVTFVLVMALLVVYTHRGNLQRMWAGQESRFERAMLFRRRS